MTIETQKASTAPLVTVIRDRFVSSKAAEGFAVGPLVGALQRRWTHGAMAQQGFAADSRRMTKASPLPITMTCVFFDVDGPAHRGEPGHAEWWASDKLKIARLLERMPGLFIYTTQGGYRIVGLLPAPLVLATAADVATWPTRYHAAREVLRGFEIEADAACADVSRIFRLPFVVRGGVAQEPEIISDADAIGFFDLPELPAPLPDENLSHTRSPLVGASPARVTPAQGRPMVNVCDAISGPERAKCYRILAARGDIGERRDALSFKCRCPNSAHHGNGNDGLDGSTVLFLPEPDASGFGKFCCKHSACVGVDLVAMLIDQDAPPAERRAVRIVSCGAETSVDGAVIILRVEGLEGPPLPMRYLRLADGDDDWFDLFDATDIADPEDLNPKGDLGAALEELRGRCITLEISDRVVRHILAPTNSEGAAA